MQLSCKYKAILRIAALGETRQTRRTKFKSSSGAFEEFFGSLELWKKPFLGLKFGRMHAAAAASELDRMLEVQHLVINDVIHDIAGNMRVIESAADDDGIVSRVVVAEPVSGLDRAPGH